MIEYVEGAAGAPKAGGPYSPAVVCGDLAFLAGQVPIDPETGQLVQGPIEVQTEQVMKNLLAVLRHLKLDFSSVLRTTVYLKDLNDFPKMNEVYGAYLGKAKPARTTVQAVIPLGALIEVDVIASVRDR